MKRYIPVRKHQLGVAAATWVLVGFAAVAAFFLVTEHRAHLYGWLPLLLLAACPLMHWFHGHGGHGHAGHAGHRRQEATGPTDNVDKPAGP